MHSGLQVFSRTTVMIICYRIRQCLQAQFFHIYEVILHIIVRTMPSLHVDQICGFCSEIVHLHGCRHFNNHLWIPCHTRCTWLVAWIGRVGMRHWSDVPTTGCSSSMITWNRLGIFLVHMGSWKEADSFLGHTSLMTTRSSCNAQRQIHVCSPKQQAGASAKKNHLVNMPHQWRSNFHRAFGYV